MTQRVSLKQEIEQFRSDIERERVRKLARRGLLQRGRFLTQSEWREKREKANAILPWLSWKLCPKKYPRPKGRESM